MTLPLNAGPDQRKLDDDRPDLSTLETAKKIARITWHSAACTYVR